MNTPTAGGLLLVGQPNVGKSVLFHALTGRYVVVANYPGTTVEVSRGSARTLGDMPVLDTPGVISLPSRTGDEHATTRALLTEKDVVLLQVGDAKNLRRSLQLTALFAEMGRPMVLALILPIVTTFFIAFDVLEDSGYFSRLTVLQIEHTELALEKVLAACVLVKKSA